LRFKLKIIGTGNSMFDSRIAKAAGAQIDKAGQGRRQWNSTSWDAPGLPATVAKFRC
jgi:hypothetical protein